MGSKLYDILGTLDRDMRLADGGTTWDVDNLMDAIDRDDDAEYVLGTAGERVTIERLDADGFRVSPPAYVQVP